VSTTPVVFVPVAIVIVGLVVFLAMRNPVVGGSAETLGRGSLFLFLIVGILALLATVALWALSNNEVHPREVAYSGGADTFLGYVKQGRVDRVIQRGADLAITLTDGTLLASRVPSEVSTNVPSDIEATCAETDARCVPGKPEVSAEERSQTGQILTLLLTALLPVVLIGAIFFFMTRRFRGDGGSTWNRPRGAKERLAELDDLRSRGVISEEEYTAKRRQILDEL
jgi:hypothetical protein